MLKINRTIIGTEKLYEEFERIKDILIEDYIINELSTKEIEKKYNCFNQRVVKAFKNFEIEIRNLSEAVSLAIVNGKANHKNHYKSGWHTTWNNKKVFLRSSYELDYAQQLDRQRINYEVEKLRILYWDSQLMRQRIAIPDFYIPSINTIIEIKGDYTYNEQLMKDRFRVFEEHGYNCKLFLNKKETIL